MPRSRRRLLRMGGRCAEASLFRAAKSGGPIAFAGLWETWTGPNGEEVDTAAIVTTRANRTLAAVHDRMPVIVAPEAFDLWLDCAKVDAMTAAALIAPAPESLLECYEISPAVNRVANDSAELIAPAAAGGAVQPAAACRPRRRSRRSRIINRRCFSSRAALTLVEHDLFGKSVSTFGSSPRAGFSGSCSSLHHAQTAPFRLRL